MQWSAGENAGFSDGSPWLKVNPNYTEINVESQEKDDDSVLNYYRRLTALRKLPEYKNVFTYGDVAPIYDDTESIMAYMRFDGEKRVLVAANFGEEAVDLTLPCRAGKVLLAKTDREEIGQSFRLKSLEVVVVELSTDDVASQEGQ